MPLAEKALIYRIRSQAATTSRIPAGIGDDCAILRIPPGHEALVSTDFTLENVHFRRDWHPPEVVGHRCLARGLSDIAAMGGEAIAAFLSLAVPKKLPQAWVDRFMGGLLSLAGQFGVSLAGGDTAESPGAVLADIVVVGSAPQGKAIRRSGAKPGDRIYVTGELGGAAAAVQRMARHPGRKLNPREYRQHFFPQPRIEVGRFLRKRLLASAMIDLSDGLSTDLVHICEESRVGAELQADAIPLARVGRPAHAVALDVALHGGEDYELVFTAPPEKRVPARIAGIPITSVGRITRNRKMFLVTGEGVRKKLVPQGWEHFKRSRP